MEECTLLPGIVQQDVLHIPHTCRILQKFQDAPTTLKKKKSFLKCLYSSEKTFGAKGVGSLRYDQNTCFSNIPFPIFLLKPDAILPTRRE
jgi:hypothetical protein